MFTDLLVIVVYFLAIFCIGIYAGRRQNSLTDYALGNRSLPWWAILASILAAEISAATFLGAPGEGYHTRNFTYAQLCIGTILGRIIVGKLFLKPYYDYKVVSIYEYLEKRFGLLTRPHGLPWSSWSAGCSPVEQDFTLQAFCWSLPTNS